MYARYQVFPIQPVKGLIRIPGLSAATADGAFLRLCLSPGPPADIIALQAAYSELEQQNNQLVLSSQGQQEQLNKVAADHAQLAAVNQDLSASQLALQQKHDNLDIVAPGSFRET